MLWVIHCSNPSKGQKLMTGHPPKARAIQAKVDGYDKK